MNSLPLEDPRKQKEWKTIKHIAAANGFPLQLLSSVKTRLERQDESPRQPTGPHRKRIALIYFGPYIRSISNLFKQANIEVTYRTTNRIAKLLRTQPRHNKNDNENSGIYTLRCATCHLTYIGQTGSNLKTRYSEHARHIRSNNPQSAYAQHILQQRHEYGPMQETMTLIHRTNKGRRMDTMEQLLIQKHHQEHRLIPERKPHKYSPLFQLLYDTRAQFGNT
jgi:hypothetical protein